MPDHKNIAERLLSELPKPDEIGASEYRLVYDLITDVMASSRDDTHLVDLLRTSLHEVEGRVSEVRGFIDEVYQPGIWEFNLSEGCIYLEGMSTKHGWFCMELDDTDPAKRWADALNQLGELGFGHVAIATAIADMLAKELTFDQAEALGFDGTLRNGNGPATAGDALARLLNPSDRPSWRSPAPERPGPTKMVFTVPVECHVTVELPALRYVLGAAWVANESQTEQFGDGLFVHPATGETLLICDEVERFDAIPACHSGEWLSVAGRDVWVASRSTLDHLGRPMWETVRAERESGEVTKVTIMPWEAYAGYFGPKSKLTEGPEEKEAEAREIMDSTTWAPLMHLPDDVTWEC